MYYIVNTFGFAYFYTCIMWKCYKCGNGTRQGLDEVKTINQPINQPRIFNDISFKILQLRHRFVWHDIQPQNCANVDAYSIYLQARMAWFHPPMQQQIHLGNPKALDTCTSLAQRHRTCSRVELLWASVSGFSKALDD